MIVSRQNQKVKDIRRLRRCKGDRAVLEGPHLVREALQAGLKLESILVDPGFLASPDSEGFEFGADSEVIVVASHLIEYLSDAESPRGVLAVASLPRGSVETLPVVEEGLYLYVDGVQDPGNLGALARVAEAFAVTAVILAPGSVHPNHPRALRASAGSLLRIPVARETEAAALAGKLEAADPSWLVLTPTGGLPPGEVTTHGCRILAIGAEGPGVSPAVLNLATTRVTIPLVANVESLNSTVAAAIALYEWVR